MNIFESFRVAASALLSNRLRSILTMLGIIIGVAAVVALVSLGQSFQSYVTGRFASLGSNLMFISQARPTGTNAKLIKVKPLTMDDAAAIANPLNVPGLAAVAPTYNVGGNVVVNGKNLRMEVTGATTPWADVRVWDIANGRFIDDADTSSNAAVAVVGQTVVTKLFAGNDPVGQSVRINGIPFDVIGVFASKGGGAGQDQVIVVPITTAQKRLGDATARTADGSYQVNVIYVQAASEEAIAPAKDAITTLLDARHDVQYQGDEDFQVSSLDQILSTLDNVTNLVTAFLAVVAGISLVVGGIGVMNIMLVSVTERTREIGLRKAIGARRRDLMMQFLIESVALTLSGGLIGVALGALIAYITGQVVTSLKLQVGLPAVLMAVGVSTAIGIFFGLYPATRAAALSPIEALRYE
jgi:putative ABC transport system permease protein